MARAVEHAGLATDTSHQDALLAQMGALYGAAALADLTPPAPWHQRPALAPTPAGQAPHPSADRTETRTGSQNRTEYAGRTGPAPAAEPGGGDAPSTPADRDTVVAELAAEILAAAAAGETWRPDYPALMHATGYRRSWCEKAVRDARRAALGEDTETHTGNPRTDDPRTQDAGAGPARTGPAGGHLAAVTS
jgi:hypothetical protein